ncbi:MAG: hypothetical protein ACM30G_19075, partial [Micromonosporaceae bacterium]
DLGRLWRQEALAHFIAERLEQLPAPFAEGYFAALAARFRLAARGAGPPPSADELQLAGRAIVLGHWLRPGLRDFGGYA